MEKFFCKKNIIVGCAVAGALLCIVCALCFGSTEASASSKGANVIVYSLAAILLSVVMFSSIVKIIDKTTKTYFIILFCLFVFWLGLKIFDKVSVFADNNDYTWYLLYIPLLFIPSMWFVTNNQIYIKNKTYKKTAMAISLSISFLLFLLALTNNFHQLVFIFPADTVGSHASDYKYNIGYMIIYAYIFVEILATIVLFYVFSSKKTTFKQKLLPSVVILFVLCYSIVYVATDIPVPYLSDMTLVYTLLGTLLIFVCLKCGLVKNSGAYFKFFETCNVPLAIVSDNMEIKLENDKYCKQKSNENMLLKKQKLTSGWLYVLDDIEKLKTLQKDLASQNEKLEFSNKILQKNSEILQKEKQIEQHVRLLEKVEKQIKNKKIVLEKLLSDLPEKITSENKLQTKETLNEIKIVVGYLKRKTNLILLAEQKKEMTPNELRLLFEESFNDLKWLGIAAGLGLEEQDIPTDIAGKFYDIYSEIVTRTAKRNMDIWLAIKKRGTWQFELTFDGIKLEEPQLELPQKFAMTYDTRYEDGDTVMLFKEAKK